MELRQKVCTVCKKDYVCPGKWEDVKHRKYCSISCGLEGRKRAPRKPRPKKKKLTSAEIDQNIEKFLKDRI